MPLCPIIGSCPACCQRLDMTLSVCGVQLCESQTFAGKSLAMYSSKSSPTDSPMRSASFCRILRRWLKIKSPENRWFSGLIRVLRFVFCDPPGFCELGGIYRGYQQLSSLKNQGCSLFAHPDISMFFVDYSAKITIIHWFSVVKTVN